MIKSGAGKDPIDQAFLNSILLKLSKEKELFDETREAMHNSFNEEWKTLHELFHQRHSDVKEYCNVLVKDELHDHLMRIRD